MRLRMLSVRVLLGVGLLPRISTLQVALGVGVGGALVDVSSFADLEDGVSRSWGRDDSFYDVWPGSFSFTLNNADGRFTPENVGSVLVTTLTEGAAACLVVGSRVVAGRVRVIAPDFPNGDSSWARVRVTCEDMLGEASRTRLLPVWDALVASAGALGYWKFDEVVGSVVAVDSGPNVLPSFQAGSVFGAVPTFGEDVLPWVGDTQARGGGSGSQFRRFEVPLEVADFGYESGSGGAYGFWYTPISFVADASQHFVFGVDLTSGDYFEVERGYSFSGDFPLGVSINGGLSGNGAVLVDDVPVYVSVVADISGSDLRVRFYVDGVLIATKTDTATGTTSEALTPSKIRLYLQSSSAASDYLISRISHTVSPVEEQLLVSPDTEGDLLTLIAASTPNITLNTLPTQLSTAPTTPPDFADQSALDLLNEIINTEQGDIYPTTTGTLTNPTETLTIRERTRPRNVTYTFDVADELSGAPDFIRDIRNLVSEVRVRNGTIDTTVVDRTLIRRAGNASSSDRVVLANLGDLRQWGQDRLFRGSNTRMQIASVVVDAMTTPTDRSADLLALVPGDRVQFTGLPSTVLGFDTWDGWFLGAEETHTISRHDFKLHFMPALADTGIWDTDRFMDAGELTTTTGYSAVATSIVVATTGDLLSSTETPYTIQIDDEQMTVTAVVNATNQTLTVVRGVNDTTAAAHAIEAVVSVVPESLFAF